MNVDLFLDPLSEQDPIDEHPPMIPDERMRCRGMARRQVEIQRELKELKANLYDVLAEDYDGAADGGKLH